MTTKEVGDELSTLGLPKNLKLVVIGERGTARHVSDKKIGTWCGMFKWNLDWIRPVKGEDSDKPFCRMCLKTHYAIAARARVKSR